MDNLYVKINMKQMKLRMYYNPQTILWSESYNSVSSEDWRCGVDCIDKIKDKIKNKFLKINNTPQTVIYEFNRPIKISETFQFNEKLKINEF